MSGYFRKVTASVAVNNLSVHCTNPFPLELTWQRWSFLRAAAGEDEVPAAAADGPTQVCREEPVCAATPLLLS